MAFPQAHRILKAGLSPLSTFKLLVMTAAVTRPRSRPLCMALLRPFARNGEVTVHYPCRGRRYAAAVRISELDSDRMSVYELAVKGVYPIDVGFAPDLVVDGGGNTGLFTLLASAAFPSATIIVCEPVPQNLTQIEKHLRINHVDAEVMPVCIGGTEGKIQFYVREANQGSFDPGLPYSSRIDVNVVTMASLLRGRNAKRILIKLDIEGMEVEVLGSFVPGEVRPVLVVGEVHNARVNAGLLRQIFEKHGWTVRFDDLGEMTGNFVAWSPAAGSMLADRSMATAS
jgi:FkbM family methyltransferase